MSKEALQRFAVIDLGSRSVRFDVFEVGINYQLSRVHHDKRSLPLGHDVFENQEVGPAVLKLACRHFDDFSKKIEKLKVERVTAYATSAMRDAKNADAVILAIKKASGIEMETISGEREARLIARGVLSNSVTPVSHFALVDIGGGSTEISVIENNRVSSSHSFDLGTVRLQKRFLLNHPPQASIKALHPIKALRRHVYDQVSKVGREHDWPSLEWVVGSSGNVRMLRRLLRNAGFRVDPFRKRDLSRLNKDLSVLDRDGLIKLPGINEERAEVILAGGLILEEVMQVLGAKRVHTTDFALKDGILEMELDRINSLNA